MGTYSYEEQKRLDALDLTEGKRGLVTMVSLPLAEYKALKDALTSVTRELDEMLNVTSRAIDQCTRNVGARVTPSLRAIEEARAALALVAKPAAKEIE